MRMVGNGWTLGGVGRRFTGWLAPLARGMLVLGSSSLSPSTRLHAPASTSWPLSPPETSTLQPASKANWRHLPRALRANASVLAAELRVKAARMSAPAQRTHVCNTPYSNQSNGNARSGILGVAELDISAATAAEPHQASNEASASTQRHPSFDWSDNQTLSATWDTTGASRRSAQDDELYIPQSYLGERRASWRRLDTPMNPGEDFPPTFQEHCILPTSCMYTNYTHERSPFRLSRCPLQYASQVARRVEQREKHVAQQTDGIALKSS